MATITILQSGENSKTRRYRKQGEFLARKIAMRSQPKSRSVEEMWDSVFKPVDETDVLASLIIGIKDIPTTQAKPLRLRKPIMPNGDITARA